MVAFFAVSKIPMEQERPGRSVGIFLLGLYGAPDSGWSAGAQVRHAVPPHRCPDDQLYCIFQSAVGSLLCKFTF